MCSADLDVLPLNLLPIYSVGSLSLNGMVIRGVKEEGGREKGERGTEVGLVSMFEVDVRDVRMVRSRYSFEPRDRSVFL